MSEAAETGYRSAAYAATFDEVSEPLQLTYANGWLLRRHVSSSTVPTGTSDATGPYPLFACGSWQALPQDLLELDDDLVSVTCVADPLGGHSVALLEEAFPALMRPFKRHLLVDTSRAFAAPLPSNHRRNIARAARDVEIDLDPEVDQLGETWVDMYATLRQRHGFTGLADLTPKALVRQLAVPGLRVTRATIGDETVAMQLWLQHDDAFYYHLGASSRRGYEARASFALFDQTVRSLASSVSWLDLGAGPGREQSSEDGLARFKEPWSNDVAVAYLCGRIGRPEVYQALVGPGRNDAYFPAYRA